MPALDLPPYQQERVLCSVAAAVEYQIPANIVIAVAENEGGKPGQWVLNTNGTHDVGPMQFNTSYLKELGKYNITASDVAQAGCYSFRLAAWRLRQHIMKDSGDIWTRAANYHSRTPEHNARYRANLKIRAAKWASWLDSRYQTVTVNAPAPAASQIVTQPRKPQWQAARAPTVVAAFSPDHQSYTPRKLLNAGAQP